jgi:hypothetical protein
MASSTCAPEKPAVLAEAIRVLRPGGRLQMAAILLHDEVTLEEMAQKGEWSDPAPDHDSEALLVPVSASGPPIQPGRGKVVDKISFSG